MSFNVSSNTCCRQCTKLNGARGVIQFHGENSVEKMRRILMGTEYSFAKELLDTQRELDVRCHFCNSDNIFPENIEIGNTPLYDFDKIVNTLKSEESETGFLICNLQTENGVPEEGFGGKSDNSKPFLNECWDTIFKELVSMPEKYFNPNPFTSQFFISITGIKIGGKFSPVIQRLKLCGLSKKEVIFSLGRHIGSF